MEQLQVERSKAMSAYRSADDDGRELLEKLFGKENFNQKATERIRSFEDACQELDIDPESEKFTTGEPDDIAYQKLKVITKAINEGWVPDWSDAGEYKWFAWFRYTTSGFRFCDAIYVYVYTFSTGGS